MPPGFARAAATHNAVVVGRPAKRSRNVVAIIRRYAKCVQARSRGHLAIAWGRHSSDGG